VVKPSAFRTTLHPIQLVDGITGIDLASSDGAALTNVSFNNLVIDGPLTPFFLRLGNRNSRFWAKAGTRPPRGIVNGVSLSNIRAVNAYSGIRSPVSRHYIREDGYRTSTWRCGRARRKTWRKRPETQPYP
jgi:hypothetical protein